MTNKCIFFAKKTGSIGVITPENQILQLSVKNGEIVNRGNLAVRGDVSYVIELGPYWGLFVGEHTLRFVDPESLATHGEISRTIGLPACKAVFAHPVIGITEKSYLIWKETDLLAEITFKDLRVKRHLNISQRYVPENEDLSISLNAQVAAVVTEDEGLTAWDLQTDETLFHDDEWHPGYLHLNPQGTVVAIAPWESDGITFLDLKSGETFNTEYEEGSVKFMEWSPRGDLFAFDQEYGKTCAVWNTQGEKIARHTFPLDIESMVWISDEELALLFEGNDNTAKSHDDFQVVLWNVRRGDPPRALFPQHTPFEPPTGPGIGQRNDRAYAMRHRCDTARDPTTPPDVLARLALDESFEVRLYVAENAQTPPEALTVLAGDGVAIVRGDVAANVHTPLEILARLAGDTEPEIWEPATRNMIWSKATPAIPREKINLAGVTVRRSVARHPLTSPATLVDLANDEDLYVQRAVAGHKNSPPEVLAHLSAVENADLRWFVANNESTPQEILARLGGDAYADVRDAVARNKNTPQDTFEHLVEDPDVVVRLGVALNERAPPIILARLSTDESEMVRESIARNSSTPPEILARLAVNTSLVVQQEVARNKSTPPEVLARLAAGDYEDVKEVVASNEHASPDTLVLLAGNWKWGIRCDVARNKNTPTQARARLAEDEQLFVRETVASCDCTPPELLARLARDKEAEVRQRVASNACTPPEILMCLAGDENASVRQELASNEHAPLEIFVRLAGDEDENVRRHLASNPRATPEILKIIDNKNKEPKKKLLVSIVIGVIGTSEGCQIILEAENKGNIPITVDSYGLDFVGKNTQVTIVSGNQKNHDISHPLPKKLEKGGYCRAYYSKDELETRRKEYGWDYPLSIRAYFHTEAGFFYSDERPLADDWYHFP